MLLNLSVMYSKIYNCISLYFPLSKDAIQWIQQFISFEWNKCLEPKRKDRQVRTKPKALNNNTNLKMERGFLSGEMKTIVVDFSALNLNCVFTLPYIN